MVTTTRQQDSTQSDSTAPEKLLVMASDGEAGAGSYAWPPALSDEKITNARRAIGQYLIINRAGELVPRHSEGTIPCRFAVRQGPLPLSLTASTLKYEVPDKARDDSSSKPLVKHVRVIGDPYYSRRLAHVTSHPLGLPFEKDVVVVIAPSCPALLVPTNPVVITQVLPPPIHPQILDWPRQVPADDDRGRFGLRTAYGKVQFMRQRPAGMDPSALRAKRVVVCAGFVARGYKSDISRPGWLHGELPVAGHQPCSSVRPLLPIQALRFRDSAAVDPEGSPVAPNIPGLGDNRLAEEKLDDEGTPVVLGRMQDVGSEGHSIRFTGCPDRQLDSVERSLVLGQGSRAPGQGSVDARGSVEAFPRSRAKVAVVPAKVAVLPAKGVSMLVVLLTATAGVTELELGAVGDVGDSMSSEQPHSTTAASKLARICFFLVNGPPFSATAVGNYSTKDAISCMNPPMNVKAEINYCSP